MSQWMEVQYNTGDGDKLTQVRRCLQFLKSGAKAIRQLVEQSWGRFFKPCSASTKRNLLRVMVGHMMFCTKPYVHRGRRYNAADAF